MSFLLSIGGLILIFGSFLNFKLFCIGGAQLYDSMIDHPLVQKLHITLIHEAHDVDCYFPEYAKTYNCADVGKKQVSKNVSYQFQTYLKNK